MSLEKRYLQQPENGKRLTQKQIKDAAEPNTITLMARTAGGVGPATADHYFYLYTDDKGRQYTVSGFPQNDRSKTGTLQNITNGGGDWGNIISKAAKYEKGTPDWGDATKVAVYRSSTNNPQEVNIAWQNLREEYNKIGRAKIPYMLAGPNSNSAAMTAGNALDTKMDVTIYDAKNQVITTTPVRSDIRAPGDDLDNIIYDRRASNNSTDDRSTQTANTSQTPTTETETSENNTDRNLTRSTQSSQNPVTPSGTALTGTVARSTALTGTIPAQPSTQVLTVPSSTALTGTVPNSTALTGIVPSSTALTGIVPSSTALTGTTGSTNTALTGGESTTALTGGTSTTALTGGRTQEPNQQQMALS
jgi:hypothetical protein